MFAETQSAPFYANPYDMGSVQGWLDPNTAAQMWSDYYGDSYINQTDGVAPGGQSYGYAFNKLPQAVIDQLYAGGWNEGVNPNQTGLGGTADAESGYQATSDSTWNAEQQAARLAQLGIRAMVSPDGKHTGYFDAQGNLIPGTLDVYNDDKATVAAMAAGIGGFGALAYGAGVGLGGAATAGAETAGAAGGAGVGSGLSSADLAALYGDAGYGAGLTGAQTTALDAGVGAAGGTAGAGGNVLGSWGPYQMDSSSVGSWLSGSSAAGGSSGSSLIPGVSNSMLLNTGVNLASGLLNSNAISNATKAQVKAGQESNALQKYMYDTTRADFAPYRQAGTTALGQIQALLANPNSITSSPDYGFGFNQGTKALNNGAAARGMTYSGAQGKALQKFGNDYAGSKLNESYNRLAAIAGIGQQATGSTAMAGQNYATNAGNTLQNIGNVRGSGYVGQANAWGQAAGNALNQYNTQNMFDQYFRPGG